MSDYAKITETLFQQPVFEGAALTPEMCEAVADFLHSLLAKEKEMSLSIVDAATAVFSEYQRLGAVTTSIEVLQVALADYYEVGQ